MSKNNRLKKYRSHLDYHHKEQKGEKFVQPSMTVPDQALSIQEMVARHAGGFSTEVTHNLTFTGGTILPDPRNMDLADREALFDAIADQLFETKARLDAKKKTAEEEKFLAAVEARAKVLLEDIEKQRAGKQDGKGAE